LRHCEHRAQSCTCRCAPTTWSRTKCSSSPGANSGLGYHTALHLAAAADARNGPTTIVMAARDLKKGQAARDALRAELRYAARCQ
jgi:hypothetical protein